MFRNRQDAGEQLAVALRGRPFTHPLVLGIPRGGVIIGGYLARALGADLDVVLSRKLRAPGQPELAIGAIAEDGELYLTASTREFSAALDDYIAEESRYQMTEIERRKRLFRSVRPAAPIAGRSVLVTDDGIATGATMIAALQTAKAQDAREVIVAVPVGSPDRLAEVRQWCDDLVCPLAPQMFFAIGQFYEEFDQVEDEEVLRVLREFAPARARTPNTATDSRHGRIPPADTSATPRGTIDV